MNPHCNINLSEVSAAGTRCPLCALVLRAVEHHYANDGREIEIIRKGSKIKIKNDGRSILRLYLDPGKCLEFTCWAKPSLIDVLDDTSNDVQISFPVLPEAESSTRFALLRAWLRWCDDHHDCGRHNAESEAALPTRLLYIGNPDHNTLRLHCPEGNKMVQYVALSHRWGENPPTKECPRFCTTDNNIKERLKEFRLSELPKTFQDAVLVTRNLGVQYLWIDSLCIIQFNQEDWKKEAKCMEGVFASAYCTIAATSAIDSEAGFLERGVKSEGVLAQDPHGKRIYICADRDDYSNSIDIDDFDIYVEKAELNRRAWVMQERVLSRRTIHFNDKQMYWECGDGVYCETFTRLRR
jgi:hypothetical protein